MKRLVVKEMPGKAELVQPSTYKPSLLKDKVVWEDETGQQYQVYADIPVGIEVKAKTIQVHVPWNINSTVARLIGEAKCLGKGQYLKVTGELQFSQHPHFVAWYAWDNKVSIFQYQEEYYLGRV